MAGQRQSDNDEVLELHDRFYIQVTSSRADDRTRVLKHGDTFAVLDRFGDVQPVGLREQGLYRDGTRFLSRFELRLGGRRPLFLSSTVKKENDLLTVDLGNPDLSDRDNGLALARGQLHVFRSKFLWEGTCYERLRVTNFGLDPVETLLTIEFDADYADIFEVRGSKRERRGRRLEDVVETDAVTLAYEGLDGVVRRTRIACRPAPRALSGRQLSLPLRLAPHETGTIHLTVTCLLPSKARAVVSQEEAFGALSADLRRSPFAACRVRSTSADLDEWISRSSADLDMMMTSMPTGPYPYAGVPWYSTPFGRDGLITAMQLLWIAPEIATGVLRYLAANQATHVEPAHDAQPGKILHEARGGEMPALGEVPFGRYYGSVDATPLFVMLAGATWRRTGDDAFLRELWPSVERALGWIEEYGDGDGDGFVEYARMSATGLVQQGWKDSHDSVFHEDGTLAEGPIALVEVQGYVYAAWRAAAEMARALGQADERAARFERKADALRARFEERFWSDALETYVLALDGQKRPCRVRTSNAGHALWCGLADPTRGRAAAQTLMSARSFSGWGVRTVAAGERRYNPMSYHNGSVWPHDNAIIAAGLARYGSRRLTSRLFEGLLEASRFVEFRRLPELFCGFERRPDEGPTIYPVACAPQAWASGAVFQLLQAALGLSLDGRRREVSFAHPFLPESIPELRITGLRLGDSTLDLLLENHPHDMGITVLRREGDVRVLVIK